MTEQLSPLDSMFLELEQADEGAHMHIGAALVFDPLPGGGVPRIGVLRDRIAERLPLLPRFAQRLSSPRTRALHWLAWEPVAEVDIAAHVHHARLPAPGSERDLGEWLADFWSHRLDRTRPLWEVVLLEGLRGRRWALATKTHHCLVDGVGGLDIGNVVLDGETAAPLPAAPMDRDAGGAAFWLSAGLIARGASRLLHPIDTAAQGAAMADMLIRDELVAAPHSSLNRPIGGMRLYEHARFDLDDVKEIRRAFGGTVNDVVLTMCAGGLRELLLARGEEPPERGLRAQIPVNVRRAPEEHALGNRLTSLYVDLPVAEPDPLRRYELVRERVATLKASAQAVGGAALVGAAGAMPPAAGAALSRALYGGVRMFNLTITNIPGPQERLSAFGAPMREVLPLVPLFAGHTVGIAVFSYAGGIVFGINADRAAAPDADVLAGGLERSFAELRPSVHRPAVRSG